jgi:[acyl-carrier-protein] S-malonyltransferase
MGAIAFLFPGQGSQQVGMGVSIAEASPAAAEILRLTDDVAGRSLSSLRAEGPQELLVQTVNAQPAVFSVDCACAAALGEKGIRPEAVAGHSLGEYAALVFAGVLDFPTALRLVTRRAELMQECCEKHPGKMMAVLGLEPERVDQVIRSLGDVGVLQAANYNCAGQVVVSGEASAVEQSAAAFAEAGGKTRELVVSGAFHSPLMAEAAREFSGVLEEVTFSPASVPVYSNSTGTASTDATQIKEALRNQILGSVRWQQSIEGMAAAGIDTFVETGPGNVLRGLVRKCVPGVKLLGVEDAKSLAATLQAFGLAEG